MTEKEKAEINEMVEAAKSWQSTIRRVWLLRKPDLMPCGRVARLRKPADARSSRKQDEEERNMEYPKPIMGATELRQMGFPRSVVDRAARSKGQRFCWRSNPKNPQSPLLFDTEGFEKWRQSQARLLELEVPEERRRK